MTIGTTRFFQNNMELFSKLTTELEKLQVEAGSGQNELKLSKHYRDVANLNAAEEKRSETSQYVYRLILKILIWQWNVFRI